MKKIHYINSVDLSADDEIHPLDAMHKDEITAYWQKISSANRPLFNGEFYPTVSTGVKKTNYRAFFDEPVSHLFCGSNDVA